MFKYSLLFVFSIVVISACKKKKKKEPGKTFLSALSLIKSQVAHVDTSLYPIMRIEYKDSTPSDTVFIPRDEFRAAAKDFLDLPDIAEKTIASRFKEENLFDKTINSIMITYTPVDPSAEQIQKEELVATPDETGNAKVSSIIINTIISNRDSLVEKKMLWQMDRSFQVTTIRRLPGKPESSTTIKISWNEVEELYR